MISSLSIKCFREHLCWLSRELGKLRPEEELSCPRPHWVSWLVIELKAGAQPSLLVREGSDCFWPLFIELGNRNLVPGMLFWISSGGLYFTFLFTSGCLACPFLKVWSKMCFLTSGLVPWALIFVFQAWGKLILISTEVCKKTLGYYVH